MHSISLTNFKPSVLSEDYVIIKDPKFMLYSICFYLSVINFFYGHNFNFKYTKYLLCVHNLISIISSAYIFVGILKELYTHNYSFYGNELDTEHNALTHYMWVFHMTKYYEFMDTFIMVLRNSYRQISFLHVYHHISTVLYTWYIIYDHPGGDYYLGPLLNSWVHIWMYTYYLLASMMSKDSRKQYLWRSQYLTKMQIVQFGINITHSVYSLLYSPYDTPLYIVGFVHQLSFVVLFGHFYYQKYKKQKPQ